MDDLTVTPHEAGLKVTMWRRRPPNMHSTMTSDGWSVIVVSRCKQGQPTSGDVAAASEMDDGTVRIGLADGLGSGEPAASAAHRVVDLIGQPSHLVPSDVLRAGERAAYETRGATAAILFIGSDGRGLHSALGDVSCQVTGRHSALTATPGVVGAGNATPVDTAFKVERGATVLLWTDGLKAVLAATRSRLPPADLRLDWAEATVLAHSDANDDATLVVAQRGSAW
jgi:hypothetical protein